MSLYSIRGILTVPLRKKDNVLRTDAAVYEGLYVKLQGKAGVEVVKVLGLDSTGVAVQRAQDNTEALEFNEGDTVQYVLTAAEIETHVTPTTIKVDGALTYSGGTLEYPIVTWDELGATQFIGGFPNVIIGRDEQAYGCCDGNNTPAPLSPVPFYLTSKPYPTEVIERMYSTSGWVRERLTVEPLDQIKSTASWISAQLRALLQTYTFWPHEDITSTASWLTGTLRTLLRTYNATALASQQNEMQITSTAAWLYGDMRTLLITYSNWPADAFRSDASWVYGNLV